MYNEKSVQRMHESVDFAVDLKSSFEKRVEQHIGKSPWRSGDADYYRQLLATIVTGEVKRYYAGGEDADAG